MKAAERKKGTAVPLITRDSSRNFEMKEAVAAVRRRLEKEKERSGTCTYLLAGASEGEGVSTAAANLALSLAYRGWKTALVDLNLRKPAQLKRIPIKKDTELQNVMQVEGTAFLAERTALSGRLTVYGIQEPADRAAKILGSPMIRRFLEGMKEAVAMASRAGVILAMEIMDTQFVGTIVRAYHYLKEIPSPYFKIYPDMGNLSNFSKDPAEELELGLSQTVAIHVKETKPGVFKEVPFGEGQVDFEGIFRKLNELNYHGMFLIEMWADNSADQTVEQATEKIADAYRFVTEKMKLAGMDL